MRLFLIIMMALSPLWSVTSQAAELIPVPKTVEDFHSDVKSNWHDLNTNLDAFFATSTYEDETNTSYIRTRLGVTVRDGNLFATDFNLRAQTDFPQTSKDVKIIVRSEGDRLGETIYERTGSLNQDPSLNVGPRYDNRYSAAGRYRFFDDKIWSLNTDLGLRFDVPLDPFTKLRLRRRLEGITYRLDLVQKIEYFRVNGIFHDTILEFTYHINKKYDFVSYNSFSFQKVDGFYRLVNTLNLIHKISPSTTFSYAFEADGGGDPWTLYYNYGLSGTLRRLIHRTWLYGQVGGGANFPAASGYSVKPFAAFALDAIF